MATITVTVRLEVEGDESAVSEAVDAALDCGTLQDAINGYEHDAGPAAVRSCVLLQAEKAKRWKCSQCGSEDVQLAMWVKPNTGDVLEPVFDHPLPAVTAFWCGACDAERELEVRPA